MTQEPTMAKSRPDVSARDAIDGMSDEDWAWLSQASAALCTGDTISPEDLLSEALGRYLANVRVWRADVPLRTQVWNAMRSILNSWRKARARHPESSLDDLLEKIEVGEAPELPMVLSPEREARFEQLNQIVEDAFHDDPVARDVFNGMAEGMTSHEIQHVLDISPAVYASIRTRIRRRLAKLRTTGELS